MPGVALTMTTKLTRAQQICAKAIELAVAHAGAKFKSIEDVLRDAARIERVIARAGAEAAEEDFPEQRPGEPRGEDSDALSAH